MGAVAIYVEGLVKEGKVGWAFVAPEVGYRDQGWVEGTSDLQGRYRGTLEGLKWAREAGYNGVLVHSSDSVFVAQVLDRLGVDEPHLQMLWAKVKELEEGFQRVAYFSVSAEENLEAARAFEHLLNLPKDQ